MQGADRSSADPFRPDLEGLRGIAILLVLAFHAGLPFAGGGFVGVDVFFVLSGFLITGLLVRERERTGRIDLRAFYARRARRILPAAAVVLLATLALSWIVLSPLDLIRVSDDALASALSVGNVRFALEATDYFSAGVTPSPFLHYWSLGRGGAVLPALAGAPHRGPGPAPAEALRGPRPRAAAPGLLCPGPLAHRRLGGLGLLLPAQPGLAARPRWPAGGGRGPERTDEGSAGARAGGRRLRRRAGSRGRARARAPPAPAPCRRLLAELPLAALGWAGLGAILASLLVIDPGTPYPGLAALAPSLGAAALIAAADRPFSPGALLVLGPLRFLGRISYSLYLVHWPILVLPAAGLAIGEELPIEERLALAAVSIVVGFLCYRFVELPFHRGLRFSMRSGPDPGPGRGHDRRHRGHRPGGGHGHVARPRQLPLRRRDDHAPEPGRRGGPGAGDNRRRRRARRGRFRPGVRLVGRANERRRRRSGSHGWRHGRSIGPRRPARRAVRGPAAARRRPGPPRPRAGRRPGPPNPPRSQHLAPTLPPLRHPAGRQPLPANVQPPLVKAANDWEEIERDGCTLSERAIQPTNCVYGDPKGTYTVALVGDSHAAQWFPAIEKIAVDHGWKLIPYTKLACRFVDLPIYSRTLKREFTECETWRKLVVQQLQALKPDLVLVSSAEGMAPMVAADDNPTRQGVAMARLLAQIPGQIGVIVDTPWSIYDVPSCISRHINDVTPCETTRAAAYTWRYLKLETAATKASGATLIDLSAAICPWDPCPVVLNGMIVYRDAFHLTATFAESLAPALEAALPKPQGAVEEPADAGRAHSGSSAVAAAAKQPGPGPGRG